ncbi:MAG: hypothetical protein C4334_02730 [Pyrinomonas sp.]
MRCERDFLLSEATWRSEFNRQRRPTMWLHELEESARETRRRCRNSPDRKRKSSARRDAREREGGTNEQANAALFAIRTLRKRTQARRWHQKSELVVAAMGYGERGG